jgi:hypothetical protein
MWIISLGMEDEKHQNSIPYDSAWILDEIKQSLFECPQHKFARNLFQSPLGTLRKHIKHNDIRICGDRVLILRSYAINYNLSASDYLIVCSSYCSESLQVVSGPVCI